MKYSDRLYEAAFKFKKKRLWTKITDSEIFAIKFTDGETGYISVMGLLGEHIALGLYIGDEGINSFMHLSNIDPLDLQPFEYEEFMTLQSCLQCFFTNKDNVSEDEYEQTQLYADTHGIKLTKKNGYPRFMKLVPHRSPWHLQTKKEETRLCEALEAAVAFAELLKKHKTIPGLCPLTDDPEMIPVMEKKGEKYVPGLIEAPVYKEPEYPRPSFTNDIAAARLMKLKKSGILQCDAVYLTEPIQNEPEDQPEYPMAMFALEEKTEHILPIQPVIGHDKDSGGLLNIFVNMLVSGNIYPSRIRVQNERTYCLLEDFCRRMKIKLVIEGMLPDLTECELDFLNQFDDLGDIDNNDLLDAVLSACETLPEDIPFDMLLQLSELIDDADYQIDEDHVKRIAALLEGQKKKPKKNNSAKLNLSFVISVSLYKGCYRHIRVPASYTLEQFSSAILKAYGFDNDHGHAFYMDNRFWSSCASYVMRGIDIGNHPTTDEYTLGDLDLYKGQQFKYLFDFGDEWRFQCKVLRIEEDGCKNAEIVRSVGKAPEQYGSEW